MQLNPGRLVFVFLLALLLPDGHSPPTANALIDPLTLFMKVPLLLLQSGLAAPVALAIFAKLIILISLKLKLLFLPQLLSLFMGGGRGGALGGLSGLGGIFTSLLGLKSSLGGIGRLRDDSREDDITRRKRNADLLQEIIGQIPQHEEEFLAAIFKLDTKRCGERLLCEVASHYAKGVDGDEQALVDLFSSNTDVTSEARSTYRRAMIKGFEGRNCQLTYSVCPYNRAQMMQLVHFVTSETTGFVDAFATAEVKEMDSSTTNLPSNKTQINNKTTKKVAAKEAKKQ